MIMGVPLHFKLSFNLFCFINQKSSVDKLAELFLDKMVRICTRSIGTRKHCLFNVYLSLINALVKTLQVQICFYMLNSY